jgi:arylsulfate sulfotransferase
MKICRNFPTSAAVASLGLTLCLALSLCGCGSGDASVQVSSTTYDFGQTALHTSVERTVVTVTNSSSSSAPISLSLQGDSSFSLESSYSCGTTLGAQSSCAVAVTYSPQQTGTETAVLQIVQQDLPTQIIALTGTGVALSAGQGIVTATDNPLVALYTFAPTGQGTVAVNFGTSNNYGFQTASYATPANGDPVTIYVAGMRANTLYHMSAVLTLADGTTYQDSDHTFTTSSFPSAILPSITAAAASGQTPQPGIELMSASSSTVPGYLQAYATDLQGNIIWGYNYSDRNNSGDFATIVQPVKQLSNGDYIVVLSYASQYLLDSNDNIVTPPAGTVDLIREIDLAGNIVKQITMAQLNAELAAAGYNLTLDDFHHDVLVLPNGHWIVLANTIVPETGLTGYSGTENVMGDVLVDLDTNLKPVWIWNEFDHLDLNRHPMSFPDWTHTNAVFYSSSDGDLVVSIRHQNWILKIDYENGNGSGDIVWHLGEGGDFALQNGSDPIDWFYAQHGPSFVTANTDGTFGITMMDNGDDRIDAAGNVCGASTFACYTTIPIFTVSESAKTATLTFRDTIPAADYSLWGGNAEVLANGDLEFDLCNEPVASNGEDTSTIQELVPNGAQQPVWTLQETGANLYRAERIPSLYPGVQW